MLHFYLYARIEQEEIAFLDRLVQDGLHGVAVEVDLELVALARSDSGNPAIRLIVE